MTQDDIILPFSSFQCIYCFRICKWFGDLWLHIVTCARRSKKVWKHNQLYTRKCSKISPLHYSKKSPSTWGEWHKTMWHPVIVEFWTHSWKVCQHSFILLTNTFIIDYPSFWLLVFTTLYWMRMPDAWMRCLRECVFMLRSHSFCISTHSLSNFEYTNWVLSAPIHFVANTSTTGRLKRSPSSQSTRLSWSNRIWLLHVVPAITKQCYFIFACFCAVGI